MANKDILTPKFRVSFPKLFKVDTYGDSPSFSVVMLFDEAAQKTTEFLEMKAAAKALITERWPDPAKRPAGIRNPFRDGSERANIAGYRAGIIFVTAKMKEEFGRPQVVDRDGQDVLNQRDIYPGCYARAVVSPFVYENKSKGVSFGLSLVQKIADGEPLGAGGDKRSMLTDLPDDESAGAATGGADDESWSE